MNEVIFLLQETKTRWAVRFSVKPCKSVTYTFVTLYGILPRFSSTAVTFVNVSCSFRFGKYC